MSRYQDRSLLTHSYLQHVIFQPSKMKLNLTYLDLEAFDLIFHD